MGNERISLMVGKLGRGIGVPVCSGACSQDHWAGKALTPPVPAPSPVIKKHFCLEA